MTKKLTRRGLHTVLPIVGDSLVEVCLSTCRLPTLVFKAEDGTEAELTIKESILLKRGEQELFLTGSKPGETFDPKGLAPLLELLGSKVTDALAERIGPLHISFSDSLTLSIVPSHSCEAWHFQYPRPGRPIGGNIHHLVSVTGDHGRLI